VGLTFTAAGTSLPNLFASLIVAKQGLGNMSVSNAFGSNTFNVFIALALPWFIGSVKLGLQDNGQNACKAFSQIGSCYSYHVRSLHRVSPTTCPACKSD
jgi:Ca2+/Na+ antiporter